MTLKDLAFILILFRCALSTDVSHAQLSLVGVNQADKSSVLREFPDIETHPKPSQLDQVIRKLMLLDIYQTVGVEKIGSAYKLTAIPLRKISQVKIIGNEAVDTDTIISILSLKSGSRFDSGRILFIGEKLKEYYGQQGFLNAIVNFDFNELPNNEIEVSVQIKEREPCKIQSIIFESDNHDLNGKLQKIVKKRIGAHFTEESILAVEDLATVYLRQKRYLNTQLLQKEVKYNPQRSTAILYYEITDPYSYEIIIKGNKVYSEGHLIGQLNLDNYYKTGKDAAPSITQLVQQYYIKTGYAHSKVKYRLREINSTFTKHVSVDIFEGERVRIQSIDISGRISRPANYYSKFLMRNSSEIVKKGFFVRQDFDVGTKNLLIELNNQGFLKAKIHSLRSEYNSQKNAVNLTLIMDEGPLTQLNQINFVGIKAFTSEQLLAQIPLTPNSSLKLNQLDQSVNALRNFYSSNGYLEVKITNVDDTLIEYDRTGLNADVTFKIIEGPPIYIKAIVVEGNVFTKDYVPIWESEFKVGDLLTPEKLEEARKRIEKLQIFSRVEIKTLEANTSVSQRTLIIAVSERNPGLFKLGAGVTNKRKLTGRGFTGITYNNLWGTARAASARFTLENNLVESDPLEYELSFAYLEPFLFNSRFRGRATYTRSEKILIEDLLLATDQFLFNAERDITSKIRFSWLAYGFESVEEFSISAAGDTTRKSRQEVAYVGPTIDIDYRDNSENPTTGVYSRFDADYAAPELGSSELIQFVRTQGNITTYFPIGTPKVVWANSVRGGYAHNLNPDARSGVPLSFAFFLGGMTTIRGFSGNENDRIPSSSQLNLKDRNQLIIPSESHYYLGKSELRFPLGIDPFGGAIFWDGGEVRLNRVFDDDGLVKKADQKDNFKQSWGLGVHVNTPVGPIKVEYARKVSPADNESVDQWHLSIGNF